MKKLVTSLLLFSATISTALASSRATDLALDLWNTNLYSAGFDLLRILGVIFTIASIIFVVTKFAQIEQLGNESGIIAIFTLIEALLIFILLNVSPILANIVLLIINILSIVAEPVFKIQLPDRTKQPVIGLGVSLVVIHVMLISQALERIFAS